MQEKYKEFWLEKDKEEIIEAYGESIHNGEVLLERIEKAQEEINNCKNLINEKYKEFTLRNMNNFLDKFIKILRGEKNE